MPFFLNEISNEELINLFLIESCNREEINSEFNLIEDIKNEILFRMRSGK